MSTQVRSFDVFDTAVVRPWVHPADLFYAVAIQARQQQLCTIEAPGFRSRRILAEQQARARTAREEVSLAEIYDVLARALGWTDAQRQAVMALEQAIEETSCLPVARIRREALAIAASGAPLLFTSDTYLEAGTVARILERAGFPVHAGRLFVSSEHGQTKWSGQLFRRILRDLAVSPGRLHHLGDNPVSDVRAPRRLGIRASRFRAGAANRDETAFARLAHGSPVLASAIAGSARAVRLAGDCATAREATIWANAAGVSGPLLTGYVLWLLGRAVAQGRRRLYFLARDGQILMRLAARLVRWYGLDIELRYLHVSRRALFLAALDRIDQDALAWFVEDAEGKSLADILARLDLAFDQIEAVMAASGCRLAPTQPLARQDLPALGRLLADAGLAPLILAAAARRRALVVAYLEQEGMLDGTPFAIVDIGWRGRLQRALHAMLVVGGRLGHADLVGYYLGMFTPIAAMPWGTIETCLPAGRSYYASLLEFFTAADHGSTLGYARRDGRIAPLLDADPDPATRADILLQQQGIEAFAATLLQALTQPVWELPALADAVVAAGVCGLERMLYRPSAAEAETFGGLRHASDQAHLAARAIAPRVGPGTAVLAMLGHLGPLRRAGDWPTASLRRSLRPDGLAAFALQVLELRRAAAAALRHLRAGLQGRRDRRAGGSPAVRIDAAGRLV